MDDKNLIGRRSFLKGIAAAAGLAACSPAPAYARKIILPEIKILPEHEGPTPSHDIPINPELAKKNLELLEKTIRLTKDGKPAIVVNKLENKLYVYDHQKLQDTFPIGRSEADKDKRKRGDLCTPEGEFYICQKNPHSRFYLSLLISYPGIEHAKTGLESKLITPAQYHAIEKAIKKKGIPPQNTRLGSSICIHGWGLGLWTLGCVSLLNKDMKKLFDKTPMHTPVTIIKYI